MARTGDGGGIIAVVLLTDAAGLPPWSAGLLAASITAPHLFGPFVARILDTARDGRTVIAAACIVQGIALAAAALLLPHVWVPVTALLLGIAGIVGPLLTGGISSRLPAIARSDQHSQRRAQGWDVATYSIGGTIGPSIVAAVSGWASPTHATLLLAAMTATAAVLVRLLPPGGNRGPNSEVPSPIATVRLMRARGPLRRTMYLTMAVAFGVASLPITAVASTGHLGVAAAAAGVLTAAYGIGGLVGSATVMLRPLSARADYATTTLSATVALALIGVLLAPGFWLAAIAFAVAGLLNSYFFAATLAARSEYAPPDARAQVFVWVGALKITAGSAGTAVAGALVTGGAHIALIVAATLITAAASASLIDRHFVPD